MRGTIDLNCFGSVQHWCHRWNVARIQLEIAAKRGGVRPADVARELGLGEYKETEVTCPVSHDAS